MKQMTNQEEQKEATLIGLRESYEFYRSNILERKNYGEDLEVKEYGQWVRKTVRNIDGVVQEVEVSGDSGETKQARFTRLASKRMNSTLAELDKIITLGGNNYESTPEQRSKIITTLQTKVAELEAALERRMRSKENSFEF